MNEKIAQNLVNEYQVALNNYESNKTNENLNILKIIEKHCLEKFSYLVKGKISKYKKFSNYDDLYQEGMVVLLRAMQNYSSNKGSFFWWANKYINTRIVRTACTHSTLKLPMKVAKETPPHKETILPIMIEENLIPDIQYDTFENCKLVHRCFNKLNPVQKEIIDLTFGFTTNDILPMNKICRKMRINRSEYRQIMKSAFFIIKQFVLEENNGNKIDFVDR